MGKHVQAFVFFGIHHTPASKSDERDRERERERERWKVCALEITS